MSETVPTLKLAVRRFREQEMSHHAAAMTYYSVMSLFPALLMGAALLGLLAGPQTVPQIADFLRDQGADPQLVEGVSSAVEGAVDSKASTATAAFVFSLLLALYSASGAFAAASRGLRVAFETQDQRGFIKQKLIFMGATLVVILLAVAAALSVFVGGGLAGAVFDVVGLGSAAETAWAYARWPLALLFAMTAFAWVYYTAPNLPDRRWQWITLGSAVGVVVWLGASAAFFFYASNFGSYNATYGAFATAIILLVWLWVTNSALLMGGEINAALRVRKADGPPTTITGQGTSLPDPPENRPKEAQRYQVEPPSGSGQAASA